MKNKKYIETVDKIEPSDNAKDRMYQNILEKAAKSKKKSGLSHTKIIQIVTPIVACLCIAVVSVFVAGNFKNSGNIDVASSIPLQSSETSEQSISSEESEIVTSFDELLLIDTPYEEVASVKDFEKIGLTFKMPDIMKNPEYSLFMGNTAEIAFDYNGHSYWLSLSVFNEDNTGLTGKMENQEIVDDKYNAVLYILENDGMAFFKMNWQFNDFYCYLCNTDGADSEDVKFLFKKIVEENTQ